MRNISIIITVLLFTALYSIAQPRGIIENYHFFDNDANYFIGDSSLLAFKPDTVYYYNGSSIDTNTFLPNLYQTIVGSNSSVTASKQDTLEFIRYFRFDSLGVDTIQQTLISELVYTNIYDSIDIRYYHNRGDLRYDFVLKPGSNLSDIRLSFHGFDSLIVEDSSIVRFFKDTFSFAHTDLFSYQKYQDSIVKRDVKIEKVNDTTIKYECNYYDTTRILIIDPVITGYPDSYLHTPSFLSRGSETNLVFYRYIDDFFTPNNIIAINNSEEYNYAVIGTDYYQLERKRTGLPYGYLYMDRLIYLRTSVNSGIADKIFNPDEEVKVNLLAQPYNRYYNTSATPRNYQFDHTHYRSNYEENYLFKNLVFEYDNDIYFLSHYYNNDLEHGVWPFFHNRLANPKGPYLRQTYDDYTINTLTYTNSGNNDFLLFDDLSINGSDVFAIGESAQNETKVALSHFTEYPLALFKVDLNSLRDYKSTDMRLRVNQTNYGHDLIDEFPHLHKKISEYNFGLTITDLLDVLATDNYVYVLATSSALNKSHVILQFTHDLDYIGKCYLDGGANASLALKNYNDATGLPNRNLGMTYYAPTKEVVLPVNFTVSALPGQNYNIYYGENINNEDNYVSSVQPTSTPKTASLLFRFPDIAFTHVDWTADPVVESRGVDNMITQFKAEQDKNYYLIGEMNMGVSKDITVSSYNHDLNLPDYYELTMTEIDNTIGSPPEDLILVDFDIKDNHIFYIFQPFPSYDYTDLQDYFYVVEDIIDIPYPENVR